MSNWHTVTLQVTDARTYKRVYRHMVSQAKGKWKMTFMLSSLMVTSLTRPKDILSRFIACKNNIASGRLVIKTKKISDAVLVKMFFGDIIYQEKKPTSLPYFSKSYLMKYQMNVRYGSLLGNYLSYLDDFLDDFDYAASVPITWSPSKRRARVKRLRKQGYLVRMHSKSTPLSNKTVQRIRDARAKRNFT